MSVSDRYGAVLSDVTLWKDKMIGNMTTTDRYGAATGDLLRAQARLVGIADPVTVIVAGLITEAISLLDGSSAAPIRSAADNVANDIRYNKLANLVIEVLKLKHQVDRQPDPDVDDLHNFWTKVDELAKLVDFKTEEQGG